MLAENHAELAQALQDAFEDAVLMGVDEQTMRRVLAGMVDVLWNCQSVPVDDAGESSNF